MSFGARNCLSPNHLHQAGTTGTTSSGRHGMRGFSLARNPHCRPGRATITICIDYHPFILLQSNRYRPTLRGHRTAEPARSRRLYLIQQPGPETDHGLLTVRDPERPIHPRAADNTPGSRFRPTCPFRWRRKFHAHPEHSNRRTAAADHLPGLARAHLQREETPAVSIPLLGLDNRDGY